MPIWPPEPLAGETIWYEDPARKQVHRDLVVAGMERARQQGKRIGRPRVNERHDSVEAKVVNVVDGDTIDVRMGPRALHWYRLPRNRPPYSRGGAAYRVF